MSTLTLASEVAMKRLLILTVGLLVLTACASPTPTPVPDAVETTAPVIEVSSPDVVIASADVEPTHVSHLGFTISALVKEVAVGEGDVVKAGDTLMVLNTPDLQYAVVSAEADFNARTQAAQLQKADKVLYVNPNTGKKTWYSLPREVFLKAQAQADQAKAVWDTAAATYAQSTLTAPFDGVVVDVAVIPGELVQVNQVVITIADLSDLQITTTDLSERDIARVKLGQSVNVSIEALGQTISGKVIRISPVSETVGGDVVYPVTIQLDEQPDGLMWGMSAEVEISTK
ncbi:MAG TPA: efflux RND transporter periplasmic adaptor subunit [Anaerolineales bacterium]|nr:efflux RND transporter periplasmic adaptor subunit [Anaerolineales bacterium]HNB40516.1 efflux RND transporter periplasmic adaptor subunit [Anaerolineales bacterium]